MSLRALFRGFLGRLRRRSWGIRFDLDGKQLDSGVQGLADEMYSGLSSDAPIELSAPLRFTRLFSGPLLEVNGSVPAISYLAEDGSSSGSAPNTVRVRL